MPAERPEPGQSPRDSLRSLRYQATSEFFSFAYRAPVVAIVNMGRPRKYATEQEAKQAARIQRANYLRLPRGKAAQDRYFKSEKGRKTKAKNSRDYRLRQKQQ